MTLILSRIESGDPSAAEQLLPLVYEELRKLAAAKMAQEKPDQTLQATALVHEAYIRLVDVDKAQHWSSRGHFFGAAAEAMRVFWSTTPGRKRSRAGGGLERVEMSHEDPEIRAPGVDLIALHEVLNSLAGRDHRAAELVKLRLFCGLTREPAAVSSAFLSQLLIQIRLTPSRGCCSNCLILAGDFSSQSDSARITPNYPREFSVGSSSGSRTDK